MRRGEPRFRGPKQDGKRTQGSVRPKRPKRLRCGFRVQHLGLRLCSKALVRIGSLRVNFSVHALGSASQIPQSHPMPFPPIMLSLLPASKPRSRRFHSAPLRVGVAPVLPPAPPVAHAEGRVVPPDRAASRNARFRDDSESSRQSPGCAPPGDALVGSRGAPASTRRFLGTAGSGMLCRPLKVSWPSIGVSWSSSSATRKLHLPEGEAGTAIR